MLKLPKVWTKLLRKIQLQNHIGGLRKIIIDGRLQLVGHLQPVDHLQHEDRQRLILQLQQQDERQQEKQLQQNKLQ